MASTGDLLNAAASKLIRQKRVANGLTQEALADACGLDRTYISAIERGKRNISLSSLARLLDALGLEIADFAAVVKDG